MATTMVTAISNSSVWHSYTENRSTASSPYGLPIIDSCSACKLRSGNGFCALPPKSLQALNEIKHVSSYPEGALIFMEGQSARGVYILCQGRVKMMTTHSDGRTFILKIAEPGDVLGLHSVISGKPHEVTVETLQPAQLAFVRRDDFLRFIHDHATACLHAAEHLSRDCEAAYDVIRSIGLSHSASEKLARLLLQWADNGVVASGTIRIKLALTHEEIAQLIGCSRETVTRTLAEFKQKRVLELAGSTLVVRNKPALEQLAAR